MNSRTLAAVLIAGTVLLTTAVSTSAKSQRGSTQITPYLGTNHSDNTILSEAFPRLEGVEMEQFVKAVTTGEAGKVTGLYAPGVGHYYVVQQGAAGDMRVSPVEGVITQFRRPSAGGVIGLLAHNYAAGMRFDHFSDSSRFYVVYGDGAVQTYQVTGFLRYQAVNRNDPGSNLIDLSSGQVQSADAVYRRVYTGSPHLVLQTCLTNDGDLKWGRLFILAEKVDA